MSLTRILPALLTLIVLSIFPPFLLASDYEGKKVVDIKYEGIVQSDLLSVKSVVKTKVRSPLSMHTLDEDIKALYKLDFFKNITVDVIEKDDGVVVTFQFEELPTVNEIIIRGNKKVSDRSIKDAILLKKDSVFREIDAEKDVQNVIDLYTDKGRPNSEVTYEVKNITKKKKKTGEQINKVNLIFTVNEARKLVVKSLQFSGVSVVKESGLRKVMETKQRGYWFSQGFFKDTDFELDKNKILGYYADRGYIDTRIVKVDKDTVRNERKKRDELFITIYIDEGKQYTFGGVTISGNKIFTDDELYPLITLKKDEVFNKSKWETSIQNIRNLLAENGYIYFAMDIDENKDEKNQIISYVVHITENSKAHVENIFITGNKKTKDFVIERELEIKEGEIFNAKKIQRSREKLYNLQYFSAVNIDVKPGSELGLVDLIFDVEEQRTGLFSFGMSYSTSGYGISLFEEVSAKNFLGRGLKLYEKVNIGFVQQSVEFGLDEPWLLNTPTSAGISFSWSRTEYGTRSGDLVYTWDPDNPNYDHNGDELPDGVVEIDNGDGTYTLDYTDAVSMDYINSTYKVAFRLGRRFYRYYGLKSELGFSVFRNYSDSDLVPFEEGLRDQYYDGYPWNWKNYLSLTGYRDTRDLSYFATRGTYIAQNIAFYGGFLGGYSDFIRLSTDMNANVKTIGKFVLSSRLNFGFIVPYFGKPLSIDDSDYLRIDTWNEGRGWQHPSQFGSLYSLRGRAELNFSLEYRYPIEERIVWALTFFDISNLYDTPSDFAINFKDFYYSFGLGLSVVIPGFPIRLYLARRFKYDRTLGKLQFANSQSFFRDWDFVLAIAGFF